jgi:sterol 3beta-glucosyltransferase
MNILILTIGSRGDVQPYIALGLGLQTAGHAVTLCTGTGFAPLVAQYGLRFAGLDADFMALLDTPAGRAALGGKKGTGLLKQVLPMLRRMLDSAAEAAPGAEAIIYHPKTLAGPHLAEKRGVPAFLALPSPAFSPTRAFPNPILGRTGSLGGVLNRLSYTAVNRLATVPYRGLINRWRRERLGLPAQPRFADELVLRGAPVPRLYAYSPRVVPTPSDWDSTTCVSGYWFLDQPAGWQPPLALVRFLAAGPAPVCVGFGSMVGTDSARLTGIVVAALAQAGQRGILLTGKGGVTATDLPETILTLEAVPHDWLFPQVAAVIHHGGAGTTGAGLRAGKPAVICPFFGDQPFWGARIAALGVGPAPIPQKQLTVGRLAGAIRAAVDPAMQRRAVELGAAIRAEDGVGTAIRFIEARLAAEPRTAGAASPVPTTSLPGAW